MAAARARPFPPAARARPFLAAAIALAAAAWGTSAAALELTETPSLAALVFAGKLPPVLQRVPQHPLIAPLEEGAEMGRQGGDIRSLIGSPKDLKLLVVYGYARLIGFDRTFRLVADIAESIDVAGDERVFTIHLRPGHKWSDGAPFTAEDFRYYWEDVANDHALSPAGAPTELLVRDRPPRFEALDPTTVRYSWDDPNPTFLWRLAGAAPLAIFAPAHYLKQFHARYADAAALARLVSDAGVRNWAALHIQRDHPYRNDNPDLPTLDPWVIRTAPPAQRYVFERNPFYHRVDADGRQLPYLDRVLLDVADPRIIAAKTAAGESDFQASGLAFGDTAFLMRSAAQNHVRVALWDTGRGAQLALFPNLTAVDPAWRRLMQDVRFRRALSLGLDRAEINQVVYAGLGSPGGDTVLPQSPLYRPALRTAWTNYDPQAAGALLDDIGLTRRGDDGRRLLPDGRPLTLVVESGGGSLEQSDVLELIRATWDKLGVGLLAKPSQLTVFRNRVFAGQAVMSIDRGVEDGLASPLTSPAEWAPTAQQQLQWSQWGNWVESDHRAGQAIESPEARRLLDLDRAWTDSRDDAARREIWQEMLAINADQLFTIGIVAGVPQPVVTSDHLRGVPERGIYSWDPGAQFGVYRPDQFWWDQRALTAAAAP